MTRYVFYNNDRVIVGKTEVMYNGKWYLVLYKTDVEDYLIIKYKNKYIKIDRYEVDDCQYNNIKVDSDGSIVLVKGKELNNLIEDGKRVIISEYNIYGIYATINDYISYQDDNIVLFFSKEHILIDYVILNESGESLISIINRFLSIRISETRRSINIVIRDSFKSNLFVMVNEILRDNQIFTDSDNLKFKQYDVVIAFAKLLDERV